MKKLSLLTIPAMLIVLVALPAMPHVFAASSGPTLTRLTYAGTSVLSLSNGAGTTDISQEIHQFTDASQVRHSSITDTALNVPSPPPTTISTNQAGLFVGFNGLSHRDQRLAGTGRYTNTQFSTEPPDQALCVGHGFVVESVNTALQVFRKDGTPITAPTALNQFFHLAPEIVRPAGPFGDFTSDPKCYFDAQTGQFFLTMLQINVDPASGALLGKAHTEIAVTQSGNPSGPWNLFSLDVTNDGTNGTPSHPGCPCFGDQPLIGADSNGFFISTNEFPLFANGFNGAQVYAMSKRALAHGIAPAVVLFNTGAIPTPDVGGIWYSVQPATTPPGSDYASSFGGTEFFLSTLQFFSSPTTDNRIAVWGLTNTQSLSNPVPSLNLSVKTIRSETYGAPSPAVQKNGNIPLGNALGEPLELINSNDDRMNQVVYANGLLYSGLNTNITRANVVTVGIAYFIVSPGMASPTSVTGQVVNQGYVAPNGESVLFPSIGVNSDGSAVITFTLVGPDFFPSAAYVFIHSSGVSRIHIAGAGTAPDDGFTGYVAFGGNGVARWGDYTAAVADGAGNVWIAAEYIPNAPRTLLANWGTFIAGISLQNQD